MDPLRRKREATDSLPVTGQCTAEVDDEVSMDDRSVPKHSPLFVGLPVLLSNSLGYASGIFRKCTDQYFEPSEKSRLRALFRELFATPHLRVVGAVAALIFTPLSVYAKVPATDPHRFLKHLLIGWDGLLHFSISPICAVTLLCSVIMARKCGGGRVCSLNADGRPSSSCLCGLKYRLGPLTMGALIIVVLTLLIVITSQLQIIAPSWVWNPFLWTSYEVYKPKDVLETMDGICLDYRPGSISDPLCLSKENWKALSAGGLSSDNPDDVDSVLQGLKFARDVSGGIVINVMARDTVDSIQALRDNVESLLPFFPNKLAVTVFENDSSDGTREAFKEWAGEVKDYKVDVMDCGEEFPDCKFGLSHRYDSTEERDYFRSSAIGRMAEFRQKLVDYIVNEPAYKDYSHMMVMDMDLSVSISPLGILSTLGTLPEETVASSGRQTWPGSLGTLVPPYDFSAYRAIETPLNENVHYLHHKFCSLLPAGDRWRNQCDAVSPMQMMMILHDDWSGAKPYKVASAFNGAVLYPLNLVKESKANYDTGDDGQRCEHIGFNMGLKKYMYVNPKWSFNINPTKPGGPTGVRALKNVGRIVFTPRLGLVIFFQTIGCMCIFVFSIMVLGLHVAFPVVDAVERSLRRDVKESELPLLGSTEEGEVKANKRVSFLSRRSGRSGGKLV